jgi:putative ABC transport system ATP-binding protein
LTETLHEPLIALRGVSKTYPAAGAPFAALQDVDLDIARGEFVAVVGPSGSGKSTLLNLLAGIDRPSSGSVHIDGRGVHAMSERQLSKWRGRGIGIVFQFFQLLPTLTALENVLLAMDFGARWPARERTPRAMHLLDRLAVADQAHKFPAALSGGQQQRVAVARALANAPPLILADEPTGNLDSRNAQSLLQTLAALVRGEKLTVVMVTHERSAIAQASRSIALADGRLVAVSMREAAHA